MAVLTGRPRATTTIKDLSPISRGSAGVVTGVIGATERGEFGKSYLIRNTNEYRKYLGGFPENWTTPKSNLFPWLCYRALQAGAVLRVVRVEHYSDITDNTTGASVKGTATVAGVTFTGRSAGDYALNVSVAPAADETFGEFDITVTLDGFPELTYVYRNMPAIITTDLATKFNKSNDHVDVTAGTLAPTIIESGTGIGVTFDETGHTSMLEDVVEAVAHGLSDGDEIVFTNTGGALPTGVSENTIYYVIDSDTDYFRISATSGGTAVEFTGDGTGTSTAYTTFAYGTVNGDLSAGAYAFDSIVDADYIGDQAANTGIYVLGEEDDYVRIAAPAVSSPDVDIALAAFATASNYRFRAILKTPFESASSGALDYRRGEGVYTHAAINTNAASIIFGDLIDIRNPVTGVKQNIPAIGDHLGNMSKKDNDFGPATAMMGVNYTIADAPGLVYNVGTAGKTTEWDDLVNNGINAIINHKTYGVIPQGNRTMQKALTLLQKENIAEGVVYINRTVVDLVTPFIGQPNDIQTWKAIRAVVEPFVDSLVVDRAIWEDYIIEDDSTADSINDLNYNSNETIDAGGYNFAIHLKPIAALEYLGVVFTLNNSGVNLTEILA